MKLRSRKRRFPPELVGGHLDKAYLTDRRFDLTLFRPIAPYGYGGDYGGGEEPL